MNTPWKYLAAPDASLFYSSGEEDDPRMGDLIIHDRKDFHDEIVVGIVGAPFDEGVKRSGGRPGAKTAPDAIRTEFYKRTPFVLGKEKSPSDLGIFDFGNIIAGKSLEDSHQRIEEVVAFLIEQKIVPVVLGGGHDIAFPNFLGFSREKESVGVINVDTHLGMQKPNPKRHSDTSFRMMLDKVNSPLAGMNFVEIGTQSFANAREQYDEVIERGGTVFSLRDVRSDGIAKILELSYELATASNDALYISFDIDAVHSDSAPGASTPLPTGLTAEEFLTAAIFAGKKRKVKMIDIVEVNPRYDIDNRTSKLAALAMMYFLTGFANR